MEIWNGTAWEDRKNRALQLGDIFNMGKMGDAKQARVVTEAPDINGIFQSEDCPDPSR